MCSKRNWLYPVLLLVLCFILLYIFYGSVLFSLNTTFFATHGDGIQSYFNTSYLIKYDKSFLYSESMNYPYGETSFYTLSHPFAAGFIKIISNLFTDISEYTIGIINSMMLFSILLGALFLYLIIVGTGLPQGYAVPVATAIAFLSPQIDRFGGHYTLSYVWAIPAFIYLLMLFDKSRLKILYSSLTGILLFVLTTFHVYYAAFFAIIMLFFWIYRLKSCQTAEYKQNIKTVLYISLQFIIPVLVYYIITAHFDALSPGKPSKPYGFLTYKASPESVLLPLGVDYGRFLYKIRNFNYVQWEGVAYVGIIASVGFLITLFTIIKRLVCKRWSDVLKITDNDFLNSMFWASFVALLYSFGLPFILGLEFLVDYTGPLQQIRGLGRFAWIFYYIINIIVFYRLWQWTVKVRFSPAGIAAVILCTTLLFTDVFFYLKHRQNYLVNQFPEWTDMDNVIPENKWVHHIDPADYQAVLPIPLYHMGSDNYSIEVQCDMLANSCLASEKTGLPIMAIYLSRASVPQSVKNISLIMEPYHNYSIIEDLPDKRPLLVVAGNCEEYSPNEREIISRASLVDSTTRFILYKLTIDSLKKLPMDKTAEVIHTVSTHKELLIDPPLDSAVIYQSFDDSNTEGYKHNGLAITGHAIYYLFDQPLQLSGDTAFTVSFWFSPVTTDLFPKTRIITQCYDQKGERYLNENRMIGRLIKTVDGKWGLIEYEVHLNKVNDRVSIVVYNDIIGKRKSYLIDELMIREQQRDVYFIKHPFIVKNNRWYYLSAEKRAMTDVPANAEGRN